MTAPSGNSAAKWLALASVGAATFCLIVLGLSYARLRELETYKEQASAQLARADATAATARADAEAVRLELEKAKTEQAQLQVRLHELETAQSATTEKLGLLEQAARPRTISDDQARKLRALLKGFAGQKVEVDIFAQEVEAQRFGSSVAAALYGAGLKVHVTSVTGRTFEGFAVAVHDQQHAVPLAAAIQHAFRQAGIAASSSVLPDEVVAGEVLIAIGGKVPQAIR